MATDKDNTRDYFRVDCPVLLGCREVTEDGVPGVPAAQYFPDSSHLDLLRDLNHIDHDNSHLLHAIGENDRSLSAYLGAINRKIDTVARHLVAQLPAEISGSEQAISLSEGGLAFHAAQSLRPGQIVALHLTLLPSYIGLACFAEVVSCEAEASGQRVSASFVGLEPGDRQIIARHVMQVQLLAQRERAGKE